MRSLAVVIALGLALSPCSCSGPPALRVVCEPDSIPDAYARPGAALLWPGMPRAFLVDEEGNLTNGLWRLTFGQAGGTVTYPRRVAYEDRWLPIVHWTRHNGPIRWDFEAVAFPARADSDSVLAVSLVVEATNTARRPETAQLSAILDTLVAPVFVAADGGTPALGNLRWSAGGTRAPACGFAEGAGSGREAALRWSLPPEGRRRTRFLMTTHMVDARILERLVRPSHEQRRRSVRKHWTRVVGAGASFRLGDREVEDALRAARVVLLACRERRGGGWIPIGGPFQYRDTWIRDGARLVYGLSISGYTSEARQAALGLAGLQWPSGAFLSQRGQLDGSGQALWSLEQAFLRPPGNPDLRDIAARATRCWRWSEGQREWGRLSGWSLGHMLPFAAPRDNELVRAQLVGNDAWMLRGYGSCARLCGAAGLADDSLAIERSRSSYLADFRAALVRTGSPDIPPSWQGPGRDWGNIAVAWPTRTIDPLDPRCGRLARRVWEASASTMLNAGSADSAQSYVGADLGVWALLARQPAMAETVLTDLLRWRNASGAHAECFSRSTRDFGANLPPHPTAAAALVALVRNALICDDPDTLLLTLGARRTWWRGGEVLRAPTRWGVLDLRFQRTDSAATWSWTPVPVWTLLRIPPGSALVGPLPSPLEPGLDSTSVLVPPAVGRARLRISGGA